MARRCSLLLITYFLMLLSASLISAKKSKNPKKPKPKPTTPKPTPATKGGGGKSCRDPGKCGYKDSIGFFPVDAGGKTCVDAFKDFGYATTFVRHEREFCKNIINPVCVCHITTDYEPIGMSFCHKCYLEWGPNPPKTPSVNDICGIGGDLNYKMGNNYQGGNMPYSNNNPYDSNGMTGGGYPGPGGGTGMGGGAYPGGMGGGMGQMQQPWQMGQQYRSGRSMKKPQRF